VQRLAGRRQQLGREPETMLGAAVDLDRNAPERAQRVAVCRVTRTSERDAIAGSEERRERRDEPGARSRRQQDALGRDLDLVLLALVLRDPLAQRSRLPVAGWAVRTPLEVRACSAERRGRRAFARLAEVHRDDLETLPGAFCRLRADLAGVKRRDGDAAQIRMMADAHAARAAQRGRQCRVTSAEHARKDFIMVLIEAVRTKA
jgi:hypothetical protein